MGRKFDGPLNIPTITVTKPKDNPMSAIRRAPKITRADVQGATTSSTSRKVTGTKKTAAQIAAAERRRKNRNRSS